MQDGKNDLLWVEDGIPVLSQKYDCAESAVKPQSINQSVIEM